MTLLPNNFTSQADMLLANVHTRIRTLGRLGRQVDGLYFYVSMRKLLRCWETSHVLIYMYNNHYSCCSSSDDQPLLP